MLITQSMTEIWKFLENVKLISFQSSIICLTKKIWNVESSKFWLIFIFTVHTYITSTDTELLENS